MKRMKILQYCELSLCLLFVLFLYCGIGQSMDLPKVIDKSNCSQYKDLFIPAMYYAVQRGDYVITPGKINFKYKLADSFLAASAKNKGKFDVSPKGDLIDKRTGKYPENIYGFPFPNIDLKDPKAGSKIIYNFKFQIYRFMASKNNTRLILIDAKGEERFYHGIDHYLYMNGRPPSQEIINPDKVLAYDFQRVLEPMFARGTNTMSYIYEDPRENSIWAYIPTIRRIRRASSSARSDPYLGSDAWLDTNYMWAGKDRTMKWKYVGEKTILVSFTSPDILPAKELSDGRMTRVFPYNGIHIKFGYEDPNWKGASWTPLNITYIPRKVWIVEQMPKDPDYKWGLHVNYVDQETYTIWYKEVYEKSGGSPRIWCSLLAHYSECPSGKNNTGDYDATPFIDEKARHATYGSRSAHPESFIYIPATKMDPGFFTINNFLLLSK
ncbi:MAG: DUF1329 domain-containing protein [Proteobacteria bacterium]|nr:DUF1329 domain-containing protein [Pseudomonadota bacterium]